MEITFQEFPWKPSKITPESIQKIINRQIDIKLGKFSRDELDVKLKKKKEKKSGWPRRNIH